MDEEQAEVSEWTAEEAQARFEASQPIEIRWTPEKHLSRTPLRTPNQRQVNP